MIENEKICTVAYVKLQEEKVLLHKAKMLMCNSQWDINHPLKSNVYKKIRNYILNGKSILREKALCGKEAFAQRKIISKEKKVSWMHVCKIFSETVKINILPVSEQQSHMYSCRRQLVLCPKSQNKVQNKNNPSRAGKAYSQS